LRAIKIRHRDVKSKLEKRIGHQRVELALLKEKSKKYKAESDSYKAIVQDLSERLNSKHDLISAAEEFRAKLGYQENVFGESAG
jgi:hypothetical protein